MTLKAKLGLLLTAAVLTLGAGYSAAQIQAGADSIPAPSSISGSPENPAIYELSQADQDFLLSLLRANFSTTHEEQIAELEQRWSPAFIAPSLEIFNFIPKSQIRQAVTRKLAETTGQDFGSNTNEWYRWLWNEPEIQVAGYDDFKAEFYRGIDPKFEKYFKNRAALSRIRLDEIRWGGVRQDGIPPLRQPKMLRADQADYLEDDNIVFGIEVNGDVRAYPKRILAWHEMFVDTVGGVDVAGVYCTLCGTVILYDTVAKGLPHNIGTSGFLYRSNKLMYDKATQSLWNTIKGEPVLGPLVDKGIALDHHSVVTTTWGEWKRRHPKTKVLSLDTGHRRDYDEGVAYHEYFATDRLMFNTPYNDQRLKNKDEVLALRFKSNPRHQLAISAKFLEKTPIYEDSLGSQNIVVLTDKTGGNRVYDPKGVKFVHYDGDVTVKDSSGKSWTLSESKLVSAEGQTLERLPYNRAFWFGWHATYPKSRLVK